MSTRATGDPYVLNVQEWLNDNYGQYVSSGRFNLVEENGKTGWPTIYALIRALQIELGIQVTADNFGNGTINAFKAKYPTGIHQQADGDETEDKVYGIIQGALLCKGYATGVSKPTLHFYNGTGNAIKQMKEDAGIDSSSSTVTLNIMKALLSMDYFYSYDTSAKTQNIQAIQRFLNANYESYIGLTPCDGVYGRGTNKALIFALQAEEGMSTSVANGNFGPSTKRCCPTIPYNNVEKDYSGNTYSTAKIAKFTKILNMALYVNGFGDGSYPETLNSNILRQFQEKYAIPVNGICNLTTWLSIFISSGDTERSALACDCATILDAAKAQTLYDNGYRYVGRYLSGTVGGTASKAMTREELQIAFSAGLRIFPIYQDGATSVSYFNETQAEQDINSAYTHATNLGVPENTVIYFAVDCDPQDYQITSNIIPYFKKIFEVMRDSKNSKYRVGIYGTRNVCTRVSEKGYAVRSFVSDMSTGFSGNLGFKIPYNWAFDQFTTITIGSGTGQIEIDKDGFSGLDTGFGMFEEDIEDVPVTPEYDYSINIGNDSTNPQPVVMINTSNRPINVYATKVEGAINVSPALEELDVLMEESNAPLNYPGDYNKWGVSGQKVGEIKKGDMFVWFYCWRAPLNPADENLKTDGDGVHKVLFRTESGEVRYGYIQELHIPETFDITNSIRYGRENFYLYKYDADSNSLVAAHSGPSSAEFTVKRNLKYVDANKVEIGTLPVGARLKGAGSAGATLHGHMYFAKIYNNETGNWDDLNASANAGAYVDLDMINGVNGVDRALW